MDMGDVLGHVAMDISPLVFLSYSYIFFFKNKRETRSERE